MPGKVNDDRAGLNGAFVVGRFWRDGDREWEGYVDLGLLGRVRGRLVPNDRWVKGRGDADMKFVVLRREIPLEALRACAAMLEETEIVEEPEVRAVL